MKSLRNCVAFASLVFVAPAALGFSPISSPMQSHNGFLRTPPPQQSTTTTLPAFFSPLFQKQKDLHVIRSVPNKDGNDNNNVSNVSRKRHQLVLDNMWTTMQRRLDTLESAGITNGQQAGLFGTIAKIHNPRTYLALLAVAGFRYSWCFRSIYYWFVVGFCVKWYRARYVFKIPVWDRQPNWNNVITSKEQEKDLKAYTCKNCGSTIFIAKSREFFFEGTTGIGGLGCYSCGAKGKDNFIMDRDRIVEEVADEDDYFEYERPLDFVSRAERRKVMKEAKGDEELANQLLVDRANAAAGITKEEVISSPPTDEVEEVVDVVEVEAASADDDDEPNGEEEVASIEEEEDDDDVESVAMEEAEVIEDKLEAVAVEEPAKEPPAPKKPTKKTPEPVSASDFDDFDVLGLD